ncbi:CUGBP Elav-like family member 2 isoform X2 [Chlorella sorokiniana]|uniref:CUGBP Elav-like family member 2 isoform X2 n=1 Tax=Chlorella sorokiniana TaxID=3076 RepID=A0A2P6U0H2_CHLSO|nr:CUGBP Elav-like family member 2 isoform X2 [Chlorella sorokiniana]|eukprot:PRW59813.1 CUGBP Elav-like family member 2 isoform X2 [Chlorella sorokiniana]
MQQPGGGPPAGAQTHEPPAVAGVPRLFVGQVPTTCAEEDLVPVFAPYGEIEKVSLVRGPDHKSRGCCMVQFKRWADAERAMHSVNGTTPLENGKGRPLVCHFANPRRAAAGSQTSESAIAPRKLFVGQIPKTSTEADVLSVFAPFGEVESVNILKSKGVHAGCAFVQFSSWASCEAAIESLHDKSTMPGAEHPLVVKFADAKKSDTQGLLGPKRGLGLMGLGAFGAHPALLGGHHYGDLGLAGMGHMGMPGMPGSLGSMSGLLQGGLSPGGLGMGLPSGLTGGKPHGLGSHDGGSSDNLLSSESDGPSALAPLNASMPANLGIGEHGMGSGGLHHGLPSSGSMGNLQAMQAGIPLPGMPHGLMGSSGELQNMHMMGGAAMMMAAAHAAHSGSGSPGGPRGGHVKLGRGVVDPAAYQHKLFIGQIPFEAIEQDLWTLFAPVGDILELAILRSQGRSKGCAFLTYASRQQAQTAIQAFNGRQVGPTKRLVVKFADQKA